MIKFTFLHFFLVYVFKKRDMKQMNLDLNSRNSLSLFHNKNLLNTIDHRLLLNNTKTYDDQLIQLRQDFINRLIKPIEWLGDAPERFDDYTRYAEGCESILELGVYSGLSTAAFLSARPKKLTSLDVTFKNLSVRKELDEIAKRQGTDLKFLEINDLEYVSEGHDLLFIDTTHAYKHTLLELERFGQLTRKRIVLHDVASHMGVYKAVFEWLWENKNFYISEHDSRGDGVCVLQRQFS